MKPAYTFYVSDGAKIMFSLALAIILKSRGVFLTIGFLDAEVLEKTWKLASKMFIFVYDLQVRNIDLKKRCAVSV